MSIVFIQETEDSDPICFELDEKNRLSRKTIDMFVYFYGFNKILDVLEVFQATAGSNLKDRQDICKQ